MTLDLDSLKRAAEGATPGPHEVGYDNDTGPNDEGFWEWWIAGTGKFSNEADARFHALANPSTILQLIARLEASERELHAIAYYTEPHYRGAGLEPKSDWIIKDLASRAFERDDETEDAERYRYLRSEHTVNLGEPFIGRQNLIGAFSRWTEEHADAAIDAQIAARKE